MSHKEAIKHSTGTINGFLKNRGNELTDREFIDSCLKATKVMGAQAEHLEVASGALQDQALDLLIDIKKKVKQYGKKN